jgi:Fic family protein
MTRYLNPQILERIEEKKKLLDKSRPLPKSALEKLREQIIVEWTYNSNAIEGSSLTLKETRLVLEQGITVAGKPLREHFEATNHRDAILFLEKLVKSKRINENDVLKIHEIISKNIEKEYAGKYRRGMVRILGAKKMPPNYLKIPKLMDELYQWINRNPEKLSIIELASLAHYKFVTIHPHYDGNGRTARLLMNLILMQNGYPAVVILRNDRKRYYNALRRADDGDYKPFILLMAISIERSLDLYLRAIKEERGTSLELLSELAEKTIYSQEYLSLLARRGKLSAVKEGKNWYSSPKAIKDYKEKRERKR